MKTRNISVKPTMELVIEERNDKGLDVQFSIEPAILPNCC